MPTPLDISHTLVAKSDQLNADDLVGGQVTVQITDVRAADSAEQPVIVHITGGHKPWKPCKTMRRLLSAAWSTDASTWIGRWLTLYREPSVKWAGEETGGIRVLALSDIRQGLTIRLTEKKGGKKLEYRVAVLTPPQKPTTTPTGPDASWTADEPAFSAALEGMGINYDIAKAASLSIKQPEPSALTAERRAKLLVWLASDAGKAAIKSSIAPEE